RLVERAYAGERIVIAKAGRPLVELKPVTRADIVFGGLMGRIEIDDEAFTGADQTVGQLWDADLEIHS
ncbi:MAG: hypothetical protein Q4F65_07950, partial [Propionibacteriaceae bacterium]|nr:hypothetical protein [Propionibacteriaceae bacterium]